MHSAHANFIEYRFCNNRQNCENQLTTLPMLAISVAIVPSLIRPISTYATFYLESLTTATRSCFLNIKYTLPAVNFEHATNTNKLPPGWTGLNFQRIASKFHEIPSLIKVVRSKLITLSGNSSMQIQRGALKKEKSMREITFYNYGRCSGI